MVRKKRHEEPENHERWLVSYADFITLLFAFFTALYALSTVSEGKYKALSDSLSTAFKPKASSYGDSMGNFRPIMDDDTPLAEGFGAAFSSEYRKLSETFKKLKDSRRPSLVYGKSKITIRIAGAKLFHPESDEFIEDAGPVLDKVAVVLKDMSHPVRIEGHTDNIPINTARFPSNWDFSSARALKILKYFISVHGMDPKRFSALGYGEYRPVDTNDTPGGRSRNRRVDIMVLTSGEG
jgi:chemotaxis protein MotB